ncbi:MAG: hypothetical protein LBR37_03680 [Erysipelotrichaceae bacterium]|jgi:Zn finger protein HypA/HybF involved in hydrogenase expression|nr:hypothetical protein [Erysipelotrichaceae bacterium]
MSSNDIEKLVNEEAKASETVKCPNCGSNLSYHPEKNSLYCEHCDYTKPIVSGETEELSFDNIVIDNSWSRETQVLQCKNCGAREVSKTGSISVHCPFCGSPMVLDETAIPGQKPNGVCPFLVGKDPAIDKLKVWARKRIMAPEKFRKNPDPSKLNGIYYPSFTYDSQTSSLYAGRLGKRYTTTRVVNGKTVTQSHIRYFNISGSLNKFFDDVLIQASTRIDQNTMRKILPYRTNEAKQYNPDYLQGFTANQYSKNGQQCWLEAKAIINADIRRSILARYDYDVVSSLNINTNFSHMTHKYVLLPIWVGYFLYHNKNYNFFINGESGKINGKTPISVVKVLMIILAILVVAGLGTLFAYLYN